MAATLASSPRRASRSRRAGVLASALAALAVAPAAASASQVGFHTPSRNIHCVMTSDGLVQCWVLSSACRGEGGGLFAHSWAFSPGRRPTRFCPGDFVPGTRSLGYGRSITLGGSRCTSRTSGVTCVRLRTGHGFFLSRARQRIF
ncbi:MAG: DUF6636 domain-containing protein [Actinomycetota bacterium]